MYTAKENQRPGLERRSWKKLTVLEEDVANDPEPRRDVVVVAETTNAGAGAVGEAERRSRGSERLAAESERDARAGAAGHGVGTITVVRGATDRLVSLGDGCAVTDEERGTGVDGGNVIRIAPNGHRIAVHSEACQARQHADPRADARIGGVNKN